MTFLILELATPWLPLADYANGHHGWPGDGWWIVMVAAMLAVLGLVIAGGAWLGREFTKNRREGDQHNDPPQALELLDRRLAEGALSIEEYRERRQALLDPDGSGQ